MRTKDVREVNRRLEEVETIWTAGYDPVHTFGEEIWEKRHWGSLHTHQGALRDIDKDRRRASKR